MIDEIETHLHLALQKEILPILTELFPRVQFIVTTHSPFVLSSANNATAYDLEHRQMISNLATYSYSALAEGYFGVENESSYISLQLAKLQNLLEQDNLDATQSNEMKRLICEFEKLPEAASPAVFARFTRLKIAHADKLKKALL